MCNLKLSHLKNVPSKSALYMRSIATQTQTTRASSSPRQPPRRDCRATRRTFGASSSSSSDADTDCSHGGRRRRRDDDDDDAREIGTQTVASSSSSLSRRSNGEKKWDDDDDDDERSGEEEEEETSNSSGVLRGRRSTVARRGSRRHVLTVLGTIPASVDVVKNVSFPIPSEALTPNQTIAISKTSEKMSSTSSFVNPTIDSMGYHALSDNKVYHNMATSDKEARGLVGLLPAGDRTSEETETLRAKKSLDACGTDFERYKVLVGLQNRDEQTFYNLLRANVEELLPILYTPTVGEACVRFGEILDRPRGLWVSLNDCGKVEKLVKRWRNENVKIAVITDGERILGLGDQGANGMGISVGKGMVYAASGVNPEWLLPVQIDTGTNNEDHLKDPLYVGLRKNRERSQKYDLLIEETVFAIRKRYGDDVIIHFEDFAPRNAFRILKKFQDVPGVVTYNDDIQGTAAVTLAGLIASTRIENVLPLEKQKVLFFGAGQANLGAADLFVRALKSRGLREEDALKRVWLFDSKGMVTTSRVDFADLSNEKKRFARIEPEKVFDAADVLSAVQLCQPTALIGAAAVPNAFSKPVLQEMAKNNKRPIVFALSNPTSRAECTAKQAYDYTSGKVVFASGTKFPLDSATPQFQPGFANNAFIFPGVARGAIAAKASSVTSGMFLAAAERLAQEVTKEDLAVGSVFPRTIDTLGDTARSVGVAVVRRAKQDGVAELDRNVAALVAV